MHKGRLEAFSDAIIAIIMTIMVLELRPPHDPSLSALTELGPIFGSYLLSFVFLGIYWNNHHHMLQSAKHVSGGILWANMHLLFWLSTIPFVTAWMGETGFAQGPVVAYGVVLLLCAIAYFILATGLAKAHGPESDLSRALGRDFKGKVSVVIYASGIALAFVHPLIAGGLYVLVALMWLVPDRRFENRTGHG